MNHRRRRRPRVEQLETRRLLAYDIGNLGQDAVLGDMEGDWLVYGVDEDHQGETDLNGDGDIDDRVLHVHRLSTGITTNLSLARTNARVSVIDDLVVFLVDERDQANTDLNGDRLAYNVGERSQGDLNGDGDERDSVMHVATLRANPILLIFEQLKQSIGDLDLSTGLENSLFAKLFGALASYQRDAGNSDPSISNKLEALIQQIEAQRDKQIATADADHLIADISVLINLIQASVNT